MKKIVFLALILISIGACKNEKKETSNTEANYFRDYASEEIITEKQYKVLKDSLSMKFNLDEIIISKKEKNDSVIVSYFILKFPKEMVNPLANAKAVEGQEFPIDSLKSIEGSMISLKDNRGLPTLLNFWFTSCPPCIMEMPELNKLKEEYDHKANFIAVTFDSKEKVQKLLEKHKFNFSHTVDARKEMDKLNNQMYPLNIFIDKDGVVKYVLGMSPNDEGKLFKEILNNIQ